MQKELIVFELWYQRGFEIDNCVYLAYKFFQIL